jgi:hypothetical protein
MLPLELPCALAACATPSPSAAAPRAAAILLSFIPCLTLPKLKKKSAMETDRKERADPVADSGEVSEQWLCHAPSPDSPANAWREQATFTRSRNVLPFWRAIDPHMAPDQRFIGPCFCVTDCFHAY